MRTAGSRRHHSSCVDVGESLPRASLFGLPLVCTTCLIGSSSSLERLQPYSYNDNNATIVCHHSNRLHVRSLTRHRRRISSFPFTMHCCNTHVQQ